MNLTEQEKDLLKCAFEVMNHDCKECNGKDLSLI